MITNLYKIIEISKIKLEWFGVVVEKSLENCRKSNDGLWAVLKLPFFVKSINDIPDQWKADYLANEPYMTHSEILEILNTDPNWMPPDIL